MAYENLVQQIDAEIERLQQAKGLLSGISMKRKAGRPPMAKLVSQGTGNEKLTTNGSSPRAKRVLSPQAREKIAAAQKKRWARVRAMQKKEAAAK